MDENKAQSARPGDKRQSGRRQKPPVTIDLEPPPVPAAADTVAAPPDAPPAPPLETTVPESAPPSPPAAADAPRPGGFGIVVAGILGALLALIIGAVIAASGILTAPARQAAAVAGDRAAAVAQSVGALEKRIAILEGANLAGDVQNLTVKVTKLEGAVADAGTRLDQLAARPAATGGASEAALAALGARVSRLESVPTANGGTALPTDLPDRVAALEASLKALTDKVDGFAGQPTVVATGDQTTRAVAIGVLRQAAERSGPFANDLAMLRAIGSDMADVSALEPLAQKGAPSRPELIAAFPKVADAILVASQPKSSDSGVFDRIASFARGLVTVRPTVPIAGNTPDAIVSRMQAAVDGGDFAAALAEREALPVDAKTASSDWAQSAKDRIDIDRLIDKLAQAPAPAPAPASGG